MFHHPRTMHDFFSASQGTWFTTREVHHLDTSADESGESNLIVQPLTKDDPNTISICQSQNIPHTQASGAARFMWQPTLDDTPPNPDHGAILVDLPDLTTHHSGKLLRNRGYIEKIPVISRYWFGQDGILTINTEYENSQGQERCWFITPDIRIRVSTVRQASGVHLMTYCTERRCLPEPDLTTLIQKNQKRATLV
jgi:hypothetical protein